jgi:DNA-binding HxlR family transcriptional regulator
MTTSCTNNLDNDCPAEDLLKLISGKWKPKIIRLALDGPIRFNSLLRQIEGSNKQAIAVALKELEKESILIKQVVKLKPLHIEYHLSEKGNALIPVLKQLELLA